MRRGRSAAAVAAVLVLAACTTVRPRTFSFPSDRKPMDARTCVLGLLHRDGFVVVADSAEAAPDSTKSAAHPTPPSDTAGVASTPGDTTGTASDSVPSTVAVLLRHLPVSEDGVARWWRAEVRVDARDRKYSLVTSVLSSSQHRAGPFVGPPERLAEIGGQITARCMWEGSSGRGSGGSARQSPSPSPR